MFLEHLLFMGPDIATHIINMSLCPFSFLAVWYLQLSLASPPSFQKSCQHIFGSCFGMLCIAFFLLYLYCKFCLFYKWNLPFALNSGLTVPSKVFASFFVYRILNISKRTNCNSILHHNMLTTQHTLFLTNSKTKTRIPALAIGPLGYV